MPYHASHRSLLAIHIAQDTCRISSFTLPAFLQVLADIVESLTGAVYLDSNKCVACLTFTSLPVLFPYSHTELENIAKAHGSLSTVSSPLTACLMLDIPRLVFCLQGSGDSVAGGGAAAAAHGLPRHRSHPPGEHHIRLPQQTPQQLPRTCPGHLVLSRSEAVPLLSISANTSGGFLAQVRELNERCQKLGLVAAYTTVQRHGDEDEALQGGQPAGAVDDIGSGTAAAAAAGSGGGGSPTTGMQETDRFEEASCPAATIFHSACPSVHQLRPSSMMPFLSSRGLPSHLCRYCGGGGGCCTQRKSSPTEAAAWPATSSSPSRCACCSVLECNLMGV